MLFLPAVLLLAAGLVWAVTELPAFGHYSGVYGLALEHVALGQRRATDIVSPVTFDYRGVDTLGEEFILFAAATGLAVLLRAQRGERRDEEEAKDHPADRLGRDTSDALRTLALPAIGALVVLGVYVVTHGHLTPGGGFQGGVILATVPILIYLAGQALLARELSPLAASDLVEAAGAAAFVCIGVGGLIAGVAFLYNFVPLGTPGDLLSAGTIPLLNVSVGIEVAGAVTLVFSEFVDQRLLRSGGRL